MSSSITRIEAKFPADLAEKLRTHASDQDRSLSAELRQAVRQYLAGRTETATTEKSA